MGKTYITIGDKNKKALLNFIGMCRMSGLESKGTPSFTFKDPREGIGIVMFDLFYTNSGMEEPCWNLTVKVDSEVRFHDGSNEKGGTYCYADSYKIKNDSLDFIHKNSRFNVFSY